MSSATSEQRMPRPRLSSKNAAQRGLRRPWVTAARTVARSGGYAWAENSSIRCCSRRTPPSQRSVSVARSA